MRRLPTPTTFWESRECGPVQTWMRLSSPTKPSSCGRNLLLPFLLKAEALIGFIPENPGDPEQERKLRKERSAQATAALEKYLQLAPNAPKKEFWRAQLEALKAYASEPPAAGTREVFTSKEVSTRARVLKKPEPQYTSAARANSVRGTVVLRAVFAADGTVKHIFVVRGLPHGLTEASIESAKKIKFTPAMLMGKPVSMWMQLEYI